jgi:hypothetical protein
MLDLWTGRGDAMSDGRRVFPRLRWLRRVPPAAVLVACLLPATGCVDSEAVSKFATQAHDVLILGQPVLADLAESCIRAHVAEAPVPADKNKLFDPTFRATAAADPACVGFSQDQPGELAILKVLTDYFGAVSQLAATGSSATGKDSSSSADTARKDPGETQDALKAASGLAGFLGKVASNGYRERALEKALRDQKDNVDAVIAALRDIVQNRYENNELKREKQVITDADLNLLGANDDPAVKALFRAQWQRSMDLIDKKQAAADAFVKALDTMQQGCDALSGTASLKAKDVPSLVQPYTDSLSSLIPSIEKAL